MSPNGGVTICAIVKDEEAYLPEWLAYHQVIGVSRFHLYDNESRQPLDRLAKAFPEISISVTKISGRGRQVAAYDDLLKKSPGLDPWVAFIDVDEFIVPVAAWTLADALRPYEQFGGIGLNWQTFGASGQERRPAGLQIEAFTRKTPVQWSWNKHVKSIVRPDRAARARGPHHFDYKAPWFCVNEETKKVSSPFSEPVSCSVLQVNHYFTRSRDEFSQKIRRGAGDGTFKTMEFFDLVEREASVVDRGILRFSPAVKSILKNLPRV